MAELEVDQTNLPRVQEVCQCFAVLEDGALAHNLQEQEIEQYYTSNVQRSQLVQKDIRVAKRLQDEEKHTAQLLQQQTTRTLEEHDSEYARMIQEEIQRCAEEARRRELEDEEIAKRIQEEEVLCVRSRGRFQNRDCRDTSSVPSHFHQAVHMPEDQYYKQASTRRWRNSPSPPESDSEDDNSRSTVSSRTQVCQERRMPLRFNRPSRSHSDPDNRSTVSGSTSSQKSRMSHLSGGWGDVIKLIKNDMSEQGYQSPSSEDELFEPVYKLEKILKQKQPALDQFGSRGTSLSRHESVREDRRQLRWRDSCFRERDRDRHVHFLDERRCVNGYYGNGYSVHTNGDTRERGLLLNGTLRDNHPHPGEILDDGQQTQTPGFRRNVSMRRSYHGDVRLNRRTSVREASRTCIQDDSNLVNRVRTVNNSQMMETEGRRPGPLREVGRLEVARNQQQRDSLLTEKRMNDRDHRRYPGQHRLSHSISEHWQSLEEERSSSEEEMMSRREVRCIERRPSRNTCQSRSDHSPKAGATGRGGTTALDLGELEQVLLDEELARRLQEEEERLASETQQEYSPLKGTCPEDFKMAQVAQDEEIAHFIQKQEIKAKRRSAELDSVGPRREYRDTVFEYERRPECERQRERMGSEGLQSPFDDFTDHQPSSTISIAAQPTRNIAEDLDPTFRKEINGASQSQGSQGVYNPIEEQPTIVPPTKRQNDKPGRAKPKDKKENIKQKENCKQQ